MTEMKRRSLLERLIGMPLSWLASVWVALAAVWIGLAIVDWSRLHTFTAIALSVLAALQLGSTYYARRQEQRRARASDAHTITS